MAKRRYRRRLCKFCQEYISRNALAWISHGRKHVREGIARETSPKYRRGKRYYPEGRFAWLSEEVVREVSKWGYAHWRASNKELVSETNEETQKADSRK